MNEFIFNTFTWTVIGFIVAYITHIFTLDGKKSSIFSTLLLSLIGAFFGGLLANIFLGKTILGISIPGLALAFIGVIVLIVIQKLVLQGRRKRVDDTFYYLN